MKIALVLAGLLVASVVFITAFVIDEGEVVNLSTVDASGAHFETQLWIVEQNGQLYLRAGRPDARWLARVRAHPEVKLRRGTVTTAYRAVPLSDPQVRATVNRAMAEKYGRADRLIDRIFDRSQSIPIRLDAIAPGDSAASGESSPQAAAR